MYTYMIIIYVKWVTKIRMYDNYYVVQWDFGKDLMSLTWLDCVMTVSVYKHT